MSNETSLMFVPVGSNVARVFGLDARTRACRLATNAGLECGDSIERGRAVIVGSLDYAWDVAWLQGMMARPSSVLALGGRPVLARISAGDPAEEIADAVARGDRSAVALVPVEAETVELSNAGPRKRERPFVMRVDPANPEPVERAAYDASYKAVTDLLTLYLWRRPAFHLTRWAAEAGLNPIAVTTVSAVCCLLAFWLFWNGHYWTGSLSAIIVMLLDTVGANLALCTGTSSRWGDGFARAIDLVSPPFWWWAWLHGLTAYGRPVAPIYATMLLWAIVGGYVAQILIEGLFMHRSRGMRIHVWRPIDSRVRLITAGRNFNMSILFVALLFARPDVGIKLVALWTIVSLIFHAVRMAQATVKLEQGHDVVSWLE